MDECKPLMAGLQAGTCFSLSALACKIGFILGAQYHTRLLILVGIGASAGLTGAGLVCQTRGLKDGNSVAGAYTRPLLQLNLSRF